MYIEILACRTTDFWLVDVLLSLDYYQVAIRFHTCTLDYQSKVTLYGIRRIDKTFENSCNVGKARNLKMLSHWFNVQCRKNCKDKSFISKSNFLLCQKPLDWVYYHRCSKNCLYKTDVILNKADFAQCGTSVRPAVYYITNPGDGTRKLISEVSNRSCLPSDIPELKRGRLEKKSKSHNLQPLIFTTTSNICPQIKTALASKRSSYLLVVRPIYVLGIPLYSGVDRPMKL